MPPTPRTLSPSYLEFVTTPRDAVGLDWCGFHIPAHCNYFTPDSLAALLRRAGLEPLPRAFVDSLPTSDSLWMAPANPLKFFVVERYREVLTASGNCPRGRLR